MAKYTQNYNLEKPDKTEYYDIETANKNNDIIDGRLFEKQDKQIGKGLSTNDFTNEYKKKIDALQRIYKYCGSVDTFSDLDTIEERQIGDVYNVKDTNIDYCWNGTEWTELGNVVDLTNYQTKEQANQDKQEIQDNLVVVSATEPTGSDRKKVWIQKKGKNLFNKSRMVGNLTINEDGIFENDETASVHYIQVVPGKTYSISSNLDRQWVLNTSVNIPSLGGSGNVRTITSGTTIQVTIPEGHNYLNIRNHPSSANEDSINQNVQVEQNSTATAYEEYIEPKIYVKNDNGVYEEFISKNNLVNYSTGEKRIGTWIDGKPLYQKTISITIPTTNSNGATVFGTVQIGSKIETAFITEGFFKDSTNGNVFPLFYTDGAFQYGIRTFIGIGTDTIGVVQVSNSNTSYNGLLGYITVKYTKTTD